MLRVKTSWSRIVTAAFACACLCAPDPVHADQRLKIEEHSHEDSHVLVETNLASLRSPLQKDVPVEPPAALLRFNSPAHSAGDLLWAAHASAGNEPRFQRTIFLSAHMRF